MFTRPLLLVGVLAACVVVPYVAMNEQLAQTARGQWNRLTGARRQSDEEPSHATSPIAPSGAAAVGPPIEEALRFDLTPQWVASRWPRVSTVVGDADELGMRVAWASGIGVDDVAGSLTYYFDRHHQLQRITFTGLTSEPRRLMAAVVEPYGLKSQPTTHAAHYLSGKPEDPTSEIIVRHLPVLTSSQASPRAEISLELGRGDAAVATSPSSPPQRTREVVPLPTSYRRW
jgi:hypothetical protein